MEAYKLFDNIRKDFYFSILESTEVQNIVDFIRHWRLQLGIDFLMRIQAQGWSPQEQDLGPIVWR